MAAVKYNPMNKYAQCYCDKKQTILLGWGIYVYANIFVSGALIFFCTLALFASPVSWPTALFLCYAAGWWLLLRWCYRDFFKEMRAAGHSVRCSKKIALKATMCQGRSSPFKIDVDSKEVDPQGDYGTLALALWFVSSLIGWFYMIALGYDDENSKSVFFPIVFLAVMVGSLILLIRIKRMKLSVMVLLLMSTIGSSLFVALYFLVLLFG